MYQWPDIALRTSAVYTAVMSSSRDDSIIGRLKRYHRCGAVFGKLCCCVAAVDAMYLAFLEWWEPAQDIDLAPDLFTGRGNVNCVKVGSPCSRHCEHSSASYGTAQAGSIVTARLQHTRDALTLGEVQKDHCIGQLSCRDLVM